ncbi:MAG TPA: hypothetical protein VFT51_14265 [Bacillales bacterium]|nr:hypothetical protein [Bacillales bacterium]
MTITIRNYQSPDDLRIQYDFWEKVTVDLPWAWKPTRSPSIFHNQHEFDPRSRCFAFDGDRLVGHMGFTGSDGFVSLGYPWVLDGYEGALQEEMFDRVFGFASSRDYGGSTFAQRFRSQWERQVSFFQNKGFQITGNVPIHGRSIRSDEPADVLNREIEIQHSFDLDKLAKVVPGSTLYGENDLDFLAEYFKAVPFDFSVSCYSDGILTGYAGIAYRHDTRYGEVISAAFDDSDAFDAFRAVMLTTIRKLKQMGSETMSVNEDLIPDLKWSEKLGFSRVSESVMMMKKLSVEG